MNSTKKLGVCVTRKQLQIVIVLISITLVKFWLAGAYTLRPEYSPHDGTLFVTLASHILNGDWLGSYHHLTSIKGVFYPLWIAFTNLVSIPLLTAQQILYALACIIFTLAVRPHFKNKWWLVIIYLLLVFCPFSIITDRPFRLGIYPALTILVMACVFALYSRLVSSSGKPLAWSIGLGLALAAFWHTREEAIWILPSVLIFYFMVGVQCLSNRKHGFRKIFSLLSIPVLLVVMSSLTISYLNWSKYGVFTPVEIQSSEYVSAYSGLLKITTKEWKRFYPVLKETREKAYSVSPAFREIKPYLEELVETRKGDRIDIPGAFFPWVFRTAVYKAGYYNSKESENPKNLRETFGFYQRMGSELKEACDTGKLACSPQISSFLPPWRAEFNTMFFPIFYSTLSTLVSFDGLRYNQAFSRSIGDRKQMILYETVTNERLRTSKRDTRSLEPKFYQESIQLKVRLIRNIWRKIYHRPLPWLFSILTIFLLIRSVYEVVKLDPNPFTILGISALVGILSNTTILTLIQITLYTSVDRAMAPGRPLVLIFVLCGLIVLTSTIKSYKETRKSIGQTD